MSKFAGISILVALGMLILVVADNSQFGVLGLVIGGVWFTFGMFRYEYALSNEPSLSLGLTLFMTTLTFRDDLPLSAKIIAALTSLIGVFLFVAWIRSLRTPNPLPASNERKS